ncbi:MAG: Holliday junction resolvase RuvX [Proteobacteria bacterium]|nr:Holliday junction resolvase RuvX [Pseudomonadota bacterium]
MHGSCSIPRSSNAGTPPRRWWAWIWRSWPITPATHESSPESCSVNGCLIGFDFGMRRIGIASGNRISASAQPLPTLPARGGEPDWNRVDALLAEWNPQALVVGLPLTLDGGEQAITRGARAFARALEQRYALPVHLVDERHTSQEAARRFAGQRAAGKARRRDAANLDSLAAVVILETWLRENVSGER